MNKYLIPDLPDLVPPRRPQPGLLRVSCTYQRCTGKVYVHVTTHQPPESRVHALLSLLSTRQFAWRIFGQ